MAFGPSVQIQIHINIYFTKFGASAFIISFLRLRWGAHLIHQLTADNLVEPTERVLLLLFVHYSNSPFAVQYYRPILRNTKQSWILDPIPWIVDSGCWIFSGTWILDSMPQWDFGVLELYSGFQSPGFRIPRAKYKQEFLRFQNPDTLTWGEVLVKHFRTCSRLFNPAVGNLLSSHVRF